MSDDKVIGHRCGPREPSWSYPTLTTGQVVDLTQCMGEYVTTRWLPSTEGDVLYYGFFATLALAEAGFASLASSGRVETSPAWVEQGREDIAVPPGFPFLRLQSSGDAGRALIGRSDRPGAA